MLQKNHILNINNDLCEKITNGYLAARAYKYYQQFVSSNIIRVIPENRITAKILYKNHIKSFDNLILFFSSNNIDPRNYIKFIVIDARIRDFEIDSKLISKSSLNMFAEKLAAEENNAKIYNWYCKTIKNIAEHCLNSECTSTSDFLRKLIREKKLAAWVISGRLSSYYLAAIPGFPKIIEKLDTLSKDELQFISNRYDMYNTEVNKAVLAFERKKANPIRATDEMIEKIRPSWKEKAEKNDLFDSSLD